MEAATQTTKKSEPFNYEKALDRAWDFYNRNIAYNYDRIGVELVVLTGRYDSRLAIKIPVERDDRNGNFRRYLESELNIEIKKWIFRSEFTVPNNSGKREHRLYNTYLFRYIAHD